MSHFVHATAPVPRTRPPGDFLNCTLLLLQSRTHRNTLEYERRCFGPTHANPTRVVSVRGTVSRGCGITFREHRGPGPDCPAVTSSQAAAGRPSDTWPVRP